MLILGIETSCDDTSVALLEHTGGNSLDVRANLIASQIDAHQLFGGVVPEIASRAHLETLNPLLEVLWSETETSPRDVDLIGVTSGPGLAGALLVGVAAGKALGYALKKPVRAVNHVEGHICSAFLEKPQLQFPLLSLVVSGGHTDLILMRDFGQFERLGRSRDDAVGEAFDKVARAIGLPIPGGPNLEKSAKNGDARAFHFGRSNLEPSFDFSYSGLKTAASQAWKKESTRQNDIAASFQRAAILQLQKQVGRALDEFAPASFGLCGGVAANDALREALSPVCATKNVAFVVPPPIFCTDNAAMIAAAAFFRAREEEFPVFDLESLSFEARSVWPVG
ncbi:O-sialoglycoprotein endopeptidase [Abditibacterium utsteinense]|uniref:tRNA N6-adenosine threonylcarbamoyltransferase n=1 Tax=Abditibacterium utsteinense TaxID=1960156 RepID=A0A2S8SX50_9BACT|nr:tRNA (adenosine(37)-N6)-threonylcarbamoyltransferase complex transferase subunit TsaD [Abditibacterium utsteinense]PQV65377.1 O-sialoglycoprotein endopeptidase [Abditibacterium utsteinense]